MRNNRNTLALSLGFGAISGMRSMSGLAFLSRHLSKHARGGSHHAVVSVLASPGVSKLLATLAAGEMGADKLAVTPNRTEPASLMGRAALGALSGFTVAELRSGNKLAGALLGGLSAVGTSFLFYRIREEMAARTSIPDTVTAVLEDALVLSAGSHLVEGMEE